MRWTRKRKNKRHAAARLYRLQLGYLPSGLAFVFINIPGSFVGF